MITDIFHSGVRFRQSLQKIPHELGQRKEEKTKKNYSLISLTLEDTGGRMVVKDVTAGGQTENYILTSFLQSFLRASEITYLIRQDPVLIPSRKRR